MSESLPDKCPHCGADTHYVADKDCRVWACGTVMHPDKTTRLVECYERQLAAVSADLEAANDELTDTWMFVSEVQKTISDAGLASTVDIDGDMQVITLDMQVSDLIDQRDEMAKENAALRADRERLDWLIDSGSSICAREKCCYIASFSGWGITKDYTTSRAAIDAARREQV